MTGSAPTSLRFRARQRLTQARQFDAVYEAKVRKLRGPLGIFALPNDVAWPRLGLAVGVRVGGAVARNKWKRLVREAFRTRQHDLPRTEAGTGYDYVVSVRAAPGQKPWTLRACADALVDAAGELDREWRRRARRDAREE